MFNDQTAAAPTAESTALSGASGAISTEQLEELLVLSQAPVSLEDALAAEAAGDEGAGDASPARPLTVGHLAVQYVRMVALFAGIGLITAAVRHYASDPTLYLGAGVGGAVLFAVASTLLEPRARSGGPAGLAVFAGASLVLGAGLGLLVGGILHFTAFPHTGAALVPAGLLLSLLGYVARNGRELLGRDLVPALITVVGILVWVGIGLGSFAARLDPPPPAAAQGGHGEAAADEHGTAGDEHGTAGDEHGTEAAAGDHGGDAAATDEHGAEPAASHGAAESDDHGAAANADHGAGAESDAHGAEAEAEHAGEAAGAHDAGH